MKLDRVAIKGFLSHPDTDWQPDGARLVSIVGANGAGKSSLAVDAPLFALYDDARGRTDDLVSLGATDMSARIEFSFAGNTYAVERGRTRKAGGKSYLELQVRDGDGWRPLTGDTIRDTQANILGLLRMDARAFTMSVVLGQGHAMAFAEATAAERKRILGQVLDLEVYARAEAQTREFARDLDQQTGFQRDRITRLGAQIAELDVYEQMRNEAAGVVHVTSTELAALTEQSTVANARLLALATELAAGAAAEAEVTRLDGERATLADRYRREQGARVAADTAIAAANVTLSFADDVQQALDDLPAAELEVESLATAEGEDRRLGQEIAAQRAKVAELERPYDQTYARWATQHEAAAAKVTELEERGKAGTSVCQACGQPIGQKTALEQLALARAAVKEWAADEPKRPLSIDREKAALTRLEGRRRELAWDDGITVIGAARATLAELQRRAARAEAIEQARAALEVASTAREVAQHELGKVRLLGEVVAEQLTAARATVAGVDALRSEVSRLQSDVAVIREKSELFEARRREAELAAVAAEAYLERRAVAIAERDELVATYATAIEALGILRQLVTAFGVTGIPARIIESVIPELEAYANELLAELRPGMELSIRAQRAKKDGKGLVEALDLIVRDPAGERPLAMFSGGERMSVSLAIAVALSRLVARRAGAAIRTLVVDEPDGLDADARRAFGQALRVLAHQGELERVVLVSHHEDLAEYGDAIYRITKDGQGSRVVQVA